MSEFMEISVSPDCSSREKRCGPEEKASQLSLDSPREYRECIREQADKGVAGTLGYLYRSSSARNRPWPSVSSQ